MATILVIEDEQPVRDYMLNALEIGGFTAKGVPNGRLGVEWVEANLPDVVVCDITMPELNGHQVLSHLRRNPATATIPFIFVTAAVDWADVRQGMGAGADDYIIKPFKPAELLTAVNTQLKKQAAHQQVRETTLRLLRSNIIYALPHELRTPLMIVLGYAEMLKTDHETVDPETIYELSDHILTSGLRLQHLIENYLTYAQIALIESDPVQHEGVRNHIIKDSAAVIEEEARKQARAYHRESDLRLQLSKLAVRIFVGDLRKIVAELVDNAFKFSEPGTPVYVGSFKSEKTFDLHVRDYGRGMTAEQLRNVGAYMQFERAVYEQQGLGFGLNLAWRLVELHEGDMCIKSKPGKGTLISSFFSLY